MKKLMLSTIAAGAVFAAAPALAQIDVTVGGHTKQYLGFVNQDEATNTDVRNVDMLSESELHLNAEGTADNGLTYGFHVEMEVDRADGAAGNDIEESYLYLASNMGRVNIGSEDGAAYLLQVAAPSADANIDGIRSYIQPVNYTVMLGTLGTDVIGTSTLPGLFTAGANATDDATDLATGLLTGDGLDYDNSLTGTAQKATYLSPVWNGFQFGASYTPDISDSETNGLTGFNRDNANDVFGDAYEGAVRYEGNFNSVGFAVGGGYTTVNLERDNNTGLDDYNEWNVGLDLDIGAFGLGAIYTENNGGIDNNGDSDTWVIGADYTTGPFQFGASYYANDKELGIAAADLDTDRYTAGVVYTAAPGLSFRGSLSHVEHDLRVNAARADGDATAVMGGIQMNF